MGSENWDLDADGKPVAGGGEGDGGSTGQDADAELSAADRAAVETLGKLGISAEEAVARAGRDMQAEKATASAKPAGQGGDDQTVTMGQVREMVKDVKAETQLSGAIARVTEQIEAGVAEVIKGPEGFGGEVLAEDLEDYTTKAKTILRGNPRLLQMEKAEFTAEIAKATQQVIKRERARAQRIAGADPQKAGEHAAAARPAGSTAPLPGREGAVVVDTDPDNQQFGLGVEFPTEVACQQAFQADVKEFHAAKSR